MEKILKAAAPAKINLYLEVSAKRPDGYHDIESVMQTVTLFDELTFIKRPECKEKKISLKCDAPGVPCDRKNLVWKAAELLFERAGVDAFDLTIELIKNIPSAAGMGGGSSDAAATFTALNELYGCGLSGEELKALGAKLGADIPFLIDGGIAVVRGIGDLISPCKRMPDCFIVAACAGEGVSTPWAYGKLDEAYDFTSRNVSADAFTAALDDGGLSEICDAMANIFESVVLPERPVPVMIKKAFSDAGALRTLMSGSGPSVFGVFNSYKKALKAKEALAPLGICAHITKPYYGEEA